LIGIDTDNTFRMIEEDEWGADAHGFQWKGEPKRVRIKCPRAALVPQPKKMEIEPVETVFVRAVSR
jgi:hypothetical protein